MSIIHISRHDINKDSDFTVKCNLPFISPCMNSVQINFYINVACHTINMCFDKDVFAVRFSPMSLI